MAVVASVLPGIASKAVIASDVDEMVCVAPDYPAGVDDDRIINGTGVEIKNRESGKCLDVWSVSGSDVPDYTNVDFYSCSGASNQVFTYDGSTIKHAASGKCLDNDASNGDQRADLQLLRRQQPGLDRHVVERRDLK